MTKIRIFVLSGLMIPILIFCGSIHAATRIAVLDFELNDITSLPNTEEERVRTASIKPLLEQALSRMGDYDIIRIDPEQQKEANSGFGYLFRFHDVAAKLGKQFGADWIIVGQHSKPSFLYSYLIAHVIDVRAGNLAESHAIELKGNHVTVTEHGVTRLAREINRMISRRGKKNLLDE